MTIPDDATSFSDGLHVFFACIAHPAFLHP
jgi:hypothetical protein